MFGVKKFMQDHARSCEIMRDMEEKSPDQTTDKRLTKDWQKNS